jgi:hypothetical protein
MPSSLIEDLQGDAINREVHVSSLLREALLVSSKLEVPGVPTWIDSELSGYQHAIEVPGYRRLRGRVMARTLRGWTPVQFPTAEFDSSVSEQLIYQIPVNEGDRRTNFG